MNRASGLQLEVNVVGVGTSSVMTKSPSRMGESAQSPSPSFRLVSADMGVLVER